MPQKIRSFLWNMHTCYPLSKCFVEVQDQQLGNLIKSGAPSYTFELISQLPTILEEQC